MYSGLIEGSCSIIILMKKFSCFRFFCIIHLNYNRLNSNVMFMFNRVNALRLKFPLILQLSDTISLLQNIDTLTFLARFIHSAASSVVQESCNSVNEIKCLFVALTLVLRGAGVNLRMEETKSVCGI